MTPIDPDDAKPREPTAGEKRRTRSLFAGGLAVAALVVAVVVVILASTRSADPVAGRALLTDRSKAHGQAILYRDHLVIRVSDLPPAPDGRHYQVWLLPNGSPTPQSVGRLEPRNGAASLEAAFPGPGPFASFNVSLDRDEPPATEPGVSVVQGTFD